MILATKTGVYINCYNICTAGSVDDLTIMVNNQLIRFKTVEEKELVLKEIVQYLKTYGSANEGVKYLEASNEN